MDAVRKGVYTKIHQSGKSMQRLLRFASLFVTLPPGKHISFLCALMVPDRLVNSTDATPSTLHRGIITEALPRHMIETTNHIQQVYTSTRYL